MPRYMWSSDCDTESYDITYQLNFIQQQKKECPLVHLKISSVAHSLLGKDSLYTMQIPLEESLQLDLTKDLIWHKLFNLSLLCHNLKRHTIMLHWSYNKMVHIMPNRRAVEIRFKIHFFFEDNLLKHEYWWSPTS